MEKDGFNPQVDRFVCLFLVWFSVGRLELTGFIKQVRQNKHGSLTGLSLEDIVANVADLVTQKRKVLH